MAKGKFLNLVSLNIKIIVHETHHKSRIFFVHLRFKISRFKNLPLDNPPINKYVNCSISGMIRYIFHAIIRNMLIVDQMRLA